MSKYIGNNESHISACGERSQKYEKGEGKTRTHSIIKN